MDSVRAGRRDRLDLRMSSQTMNAAISAPAAALPMPIPAAAPELIGFEFDEALVLFEGLGVDIGSGSRARVGLADFLPFGVALLLDAVLEVVVTDEVGDVVGFGFAEVGVAGVGWEPKWERLNGEITPGCSGSAIWTGKMVPPLEV